MGLAPSGSVCGRTGGGIEGHREFGGVGREAEAVADGAGARGSKSKSMRDASAGEL